MSLGALSYPQTILSLALFTWTLVVVSGVKTVTLAKTVENGGQVDESARGDGGWGWGGAGGGLGGLGGQSQQYHYSAYPSHGEHSGLSFDVKTGIGAIIAILVIVALVTIFWGKSGSGTGWESRSSDYKNIDLVATAEKVLTAVEKLYSVYSKKS